MCENKEGRFRFSYSSVRTSSTSSLYPREKNQSKTILNYYPKTRKHDVFDVDSPDKENRDARKKKKAEGGTTSSTALQEYYYKDTEIQIKKFSRDKYGYWDAIKIEDLVFSDYLKLLDDWGEYYKSLQTNDYVTGKPEKWYLDPLIVSDYLMSDDSAQFQIKNPLGLYHHLGKLYQRDYIVDYTHPDEEFQELSSVSNLVVTANPSYNSWKVLNKIDQPCTTSTVQGSLNTVISTLAKSGGYLQNTERHSSSMKIVELNNKNEMIYKFFDHNLLYSVFNNGLNDEKFIQSTSSGSTKNCITRGFFVRNPDKLDEMSEVVLKYADHKALNKSLGNYSQLASAPKPKTINAQDAVS